MNLLKDDLYLEDLEYVSRLALPWEELQDACILVSGATGLLGSFLVDLLMKKNTEGLNCSVFTISRDKNRAESRFSHWKGMNQLHILAHDINEPLAEKNFANVKYVLHLASNTHPMQYSTEPIGTIATNIIGTKNMLDFAVENHAKRFLFASSTEIYGENRGDVELFSEDYCGYLDSNTLRAGYPESKRCGEALCQAYKVQYQLDIVVPRFSRTYGPTVLSNDTKAINQFINKAVLGQDIVLKSAGTQLYSYMYVADAVAGMMTILLNGCNGAAYNIADEKSDITLKDLATLISKYAGQKVVFECPDKVEAAGYSKATKARLDGSKLKMLGWNANYDIKTGVERTIRILRNL